MQYNPISIITLYKKEVQRFTKIPLQTIVAPAATSLLFMVIFTTAIGSVRTNYPLDSFKSFLFPGLIMMTIIQNAFMNNSSSILMSKVQGNIVDLLMPPLNNIEIILAFTLAGITRGIVVAVACALMMYPFADVSIYNIYIILIFAIIASAIMSLIGTISGIWAEKMGPSWNGRQLCHCSVVLSFWYILFNNCVTRTHSNGKFNKSIFLYD